MNIKLLVNSSFMVMFSCIVAFFTKPVTNLFFGTMGLDNFIIVTYCLFLYYNKLDSGKFIIATLFCESFLSSFFKAGIVTNFCISFTQIFVMLLFLVFINDNHLKKVNFNKLCVIVLMIIATISSILFTFVSYYFYGLSYWIFILSIISSPISGLSSVFIVVNFIKIYRNINYSKFLHVLNILKSKLIV